MAKNSRINLVKIIIILLVVMLMLLLIILMLTLTKEEEKALHQPEASRKQLEYINSKAWNEEEYPFAAYMLFMEYNGSLTSENIVKSMSYVANQVIPKYYETLRNASEYEILEYYNANSKSIKIDTGIATEEKFVDLIKSIQNLKTEELIFDSYRIDEESIQVYNTYAEIILCITYKDNDEIKLNVKIYKHMKRETSSLIYTAVKE